MSEREREEILSMQEREETLLMQKREGEEKPMT